MSTFKDTFISISGKNNRDVQLRYSDIQKGRWDILNKAVKFGCRLNNCGEKELSFKKLEIERTRGYLNQSCYPTDTDENIYNILNSEDVTLEELIKNNLK